MCFIPFLEDAGADDYCGPYDGVLCCELLEHLTPKKGRQLLGEIREDMKPGAMLCVTVPKAGGSREKYPGHIRSFTAMDLMACLRNAGFTKFSGGEANIADIWWMAVCYA